MLEAVVSYGNDFALYHLFPEQEGVYHAELIRFYGSADAEPPPKQILLVKGVRKWIGNFDLPELLNELGQAIETSLPENERVLNHFKKDHSTNPKK
jgi:hypothetical protein